MPQVTKPIILDDTGQAIVEKLQSIAEAIGIDAVRFTEQVLTEVQKAQARQNIGALGEGDIPTKVSDLTNDSGFQTASQVSTAVAAETTRAQGRENEIEDAIPDVSGFITKSVNDLVNYYKKNETYTQAEVQALINAVQQFTYEVVSELPTASASTMHKIYLVPSADPQSQNTKNEYITIQSGQTYSWEQIGSTAIDLSDYPTTAQMNTAISNALTSALADYTTTAALTALLAGKQNTIDAQHKLPYNLLTDTPDIPSVPTIATTISSESVNTETAGAKAVYDAIHDASEGCIESETYIPDEPTAEIPILRYDEQTLTEAQKAQARENIGAASEAKFTGEQWTATLTDGTTVTKKVVLYD